MNETRESPGLYSPAPRWIKFSKYELIEHDGNIYVIPARKAEIEYYRPFEEPSALFKAFIDMAQEIGSKVTKGINSSIKLIEQGVELPEMIPEDAIKMQRQYGDIIVRFADRYGLLGLFWNFLYSITEWPLNLKTNVEGQNTETIVRLSDRAVSLDPSRLWAEHILEKGFNLQYNEYARLFFPRSRPPYPNLMKNQNTFWKDYAEPVPHFTTEAGHMLQHFKRWQRFESSGGVPEDSLPRDLRKRHGITWGDYLGDIRVWGIGLRLAYDSNQDIWQQAYSFKSLLDALKIMQINNIIESRQRVRLCSKCKQRVFIDMSGRKKVCDTCRNFSNDRVEKHRKKPKVMELFKEGIEPDIIAARLNMDIDNVNEWIKEENQNHGRVD